MRYTHADTIAALATPAGLGGIAIVRISGPRAQHIVSALFVAKKQPFTFIPRYMHYGHIQDEHGSLLDEVLVVLMPGPASATGEDVAEIHCHGGVGISSLILELVISQGARLAAGGEFTKRAFLHGRIDLTQAEAVAELISAPTKEGVRLAKAKLEGHLAARIHALRKNIDALRSQVLLAVDFPDEDAELLPRAAFQQTLRDARTAIQELIQGFSRAQLWREGATAVFVGQVNAGKSSLFNVLLGRSRAIVSPLAGTTRDYIEESVNLDGLPVRIIDTAGLRATDDAIEGVGIARSYALAEDADILVLVVDACLGLQQTELDFLHAYHEVAAKNRLLIVWNKTDKAAALPVPKLLASMPVVLTSAAEGSGVDAFAAQLRTLVLGLQPGAEHIASASDIAPNVRQTQLLRTAFTEIELTMHDLLSGVPVDMLGDRLDAIVGFLDEITGSSSTEELLDTIFSSFCIGK